MLRERQLFAAGAGPYNKSRELRALVENLRAIEGQEQESWEQSQLAGESPGGK
jgi:hypothetical protein